MSNQCNQILRHLKSGKSITPLEALNRFGCLRLGARIYDLKKRGYAIGREMIEVQGQSGDTSRVARYSLLNEAER